MNQHSCELKLIELSNSKFRKSFKLTSKDKEFIEARGLEMIKYHAVNFIKNRIAPEMPSNDGQQTPFRGHPVFTAQHATATCCRSCILKWHNIPQTKELTDREIDFITELIMSWIEKQLK